MAFPYLPQKHIRSSFSRLHLTVPVTARPLQKLMSYINSTWITSSFKFRISTWSGFGQSVRTNSDAEGWHQRLNSTAKGQSLQLFAMTKLLNEEARYVPMQIQLVSEQKLTRSQRSATISCQSKIFQLWLSYSKEEITPSNLLKSVGLLIAPKTV